MTGVEQWIGEVIGAAALGLLAMLVRRVFSVTESVVNFIDTAGSKLQHIDEVGDATYALHTTNDPNSLFQVGQIHEALNEVVEQSKRVEALHAAVFELSLLQSARLSDPEDQRSVKAIERVLREKLQNG